MENISPTRMNLLQRRAQIVLALQGVELLKRKRDALVSNFFEVARQASRSRRELEELSRKAHLSLALSKAFGRPEDTRVAEISSKREILSEIETKNIWGVRVPEIKTPHLRREPWERDWNPAFQNIHLLKASEEFERLMEKIISLANEEIKIERLGGEIKKTTRRVNALEQVVVPQIRTEITFIKGVLEEREREDTFRLKRLKKKRQD
ncbi:MAG: V-type ATP synthase subunit D [Caldiserica bacterium]|jgi:V/A-type H+-transporting ATPase subunit D|nr:V-type ATP synthase subunit D [Caldisericota bacterium]MDH7561764.1 V-type ATP synthase subunit D [Caldisericota bacterium]